MFSFHELHSLYAEASLVGLAIAVLIYRCFGSNEWIKTHGVILVSYYAIGGIAFDELEGWPLLDTVYFLTVTITTVGYGDICPETDAGKIFTVLYALIGIIFVFAALSPLVDALMFFKDLILKPFTPPDPTAATEEDGELSLEDLRARGNWGFKYGAALAGPGLIFVLGLLIGFFVMHLDLVDGIYWSMITMTTIGYGDISAQSFYAKLTLILYLPTAVAALADALGVVAQIGTAKMLCETDFAAQADTLLLGEAGGANPNPDETLTEAEFLISVLKDNGIVDDMTVMAIRLQFAHIVRHDTSTVGDKVLDDRMCFREMIAQGRVRQTSPKCAAETADGKKIEQVNLKAADGGFQEWREKHWWPRVYDGQQHGVQVRLDLSVAEERGEATIMYEEQQKKGKGKGGNNQPPTKTVKSKDGELKTFQKLPEVAEVLPASQRAMAKAKAANTRQEIKAAAAEVSAAKKTGPATWRDLENARLIREKKKAKARWEAAQWCVLFCLIIGFVIFVGKDDGLGLLPPGVGAEAQKASIASTISDLEAKLASAREAMAAIE